MSLEQEFPDSDAYLQYEEVLQSFIDDLKKQAIPHQS